MAAMERGILLIDKPAGMTSHDVVARLRRELGRKDLGHAGTLDPQATGLLVVALGAATKWLPYLPSDKLYSAALHLGLETDSEDIWGKELRRSDASALDEARVRQALESLKGLSEQVPPMVSALKRGGRPLYELAREGVEVERPPRPIEIHALKVTAVRLPEADFEVHCGGGTYVRSLCAEAGRRLSVGACLSRLRRLACGGFKVDQALDQALWTKDALLGALLGPEQALANLGRRELTQAQAADVSHGRAVALEQGEEGQVLRLHGPDGSLAALAVAGLKEGRWLAQPERVFSAA